MGYDCECGQNCRFCEGCGHAECDCKCDSDFSDDNLENEDDKKWR